jgi:phage tail-like protein
MAATGRRREAYGAYFFGVEIEGVQEAFFRSCSGLQSEAEVVAVQEGGINEFEHKLIGRTKLSNIVLKQGFANSFLWQKRLQFVNSDPGTSLQRFSGTIIQFGPGGNRAHSWQFANAWICKWEGPDFDATKNEISIESIEIAHEGLTYKAGG